jgi:paraquat-inducible protein B
MKSCPSCGLIQRLPVATASASAVCGRCGTKLRVGMRGGNALAGAMALAALVLYLPAVTMPFLRIEQWGHTQENSLIGGVIALFADGEWFVAITVLAFSIVLPPVKLAALLLLGTVPGWLRSHVRVRTMRMVEILGRWGMLDVLLVAVLLAFIKLGDLVDFAAGPGVIVFGVFVLLSLLAAYFFDPHAIWDEEAMTCETSSATPNQPSPQSPPDKASLPTAKLAARGGASVAWLIPVGAVIAVAGFAYWGWQEQGLQIAITFAEGRGLKAGDQLRYRSTVAGQVEQVAFSENLDAVQAIVRLHPGTEALAREGSQFWVVRPEVSLSGVAGLDTVMGANYLAVLPGPSGARRQHQFIGLEEPPLADIRESGGLNIVLQADDAAGVAVGSPVYYRQIRVGGVRDVLLASDASAVEIHAYVRPEYRCLVFTNTKFWKTKGVKIEAGWTGVSVEMGAAQTLLQSGIALSVPPEGAAPANEGHRFVLHGEPQDEWLAWRPTLGRGELPAQLPHSTWAMLEWTEVGYVYNTTQKRRGWVLVTTNGIVGPKDMLIAPEDSQDAHLLLAGKSIDVAGEVESVGTGLVRFKATDLSSASTVRFRAAEPPEDVLIVLDSQQEPLFISAARLSQENSFWQIDPAVPLDPGCHGAAVVSAADTCVVGFLLTGGESSRIGLYRELEKSDEPGRQKL